MKEQRCKYAGVTTCKRYDEKSYTCLKGLKSFCGEYRRREKELKQ